MATAHQQVQNKYRARTPSLRRASSGGADLLPYWGACSPCLEASFQIIS